MKKLLVLVLALVLVVSFASISMAGTTTFSGEVTEHLTSGVFGLDNNFGKANFDCTKTYNDNLSAGINFYYKWDGLAATSQTFGVDTNGFVKFNYAPVVVTVNTSVGGNVQKDLDSTDVAFCTLASNPGVQVDYTVVKGATVTAVANTGKTAQDFNYLVKGVYSSDSLTVGAGYQADGVNDAADVYGSLKLGPVTVGGEYANRTKVTETGILGTLAATFGPLSANAKVIVLSDGFKCVDTGDKADHSAYDNLRDGTIAGGTGIHVDATYKLTDALSVNGNFETAETSMSYLGGATYKLTDALSVGASYKALDKTNAVNVTVTDTFAAGLVGTLSLDMSPSDKTQSYTAKVDAIF